MADYEIIELSKAYDRKGFDSGSEPLNTYFQRQVSQDVKRKVANCFIAVNGDEIVGYYTLASTSIPLVDLPEAHAKKLPRYPLIPAALIGRLAISKKYQGQGIGGELIADAAIRSVRSDLACYALIVEAINENAVKFYQHHQFTQFVSKPRVLYLPLGGLNLG